MTGRPISSLSRCAGTVEFGKLRGMTHSDATAITRAVDQVKRADRVLRARTARLETLLREATRGRGAGEASIRRIPVVTEIYTAEAASEPSERE